MPATGPTGFARHSVRDELTVPMGSHRPGTQAMSPSPRPATLYEVHANTQMRQYNTTEISRLGNKSQTRSGIKLK